MRILLSLTLASTLGCGPGLAHSVCDCVCLDGSHRTLCSTLEEAGSGLNACAGYSAEACPVNLAASQRRGYAAPETGAVNCRDAEVYDGASESWMTVRVCDVQPDSSP